MNTAGEVVKYCKEKPMFREVSMKRYVAATSTRRTFHHVTCADIESRQNLTLCKSRAVATYEGKYWSYITNFQHTWDTCIYAGVSRYKQAFSTGVGLTLLVRCRICCCPACLSRDFSNCALKVKKIIVAIVLQARLKSYVFRLERFKTLEKFVVVV